MLLISDDFSRFHVDEFNATKVPCSYPLRAIFLYERLAGTPEF